MSKNATLLSLYYHSSIKRLQINWRIQYEYIYCITIILILKVYDNISYDEYSYAGAVFWNENENNYLC